MVMLWPLVFLLALALQPEKEGKNCGVTTKEMLGLFCSSILTHLTHLFHCSSILTSVILTNANLSKHTCPNKYLIRYKFVSMCENLFLFVTPAKCLILLMSAGYAYVLTLCIC